MKKIAYDSMKFDALKIVDDKKGYMKVNAVITKEGVYPTLTAEPSSQNVNF